MKHYSTHDVFTIAELGNVPVEVVGPNDEAMLQSARVSLSEARISPLKQTRTC